MADAEYAELEIELDWRSENVYSVEMSLTDPDNPTIRSLTHDALATISLDAFDKLRTGRDFDKYGKALFDALLSDGEAKSLFRDARDLKSPLRVVLKLSPSAKALHDLCWESLYDTVGDRRLLEDNRFLFSRFLASVDNRTNPRRSLRDIRALVAVADPAPKGNLSVAPVPKNMLDQAAESLRGLEKDNVTRFKGRVTLDALMASLEAKPCEVLYLVCHGVRGAEDSSLFLENEKGLVEPVRGREFVRRIGELPQPPNLVVLAACESAAPDRKRRQTSDQPGAVAAVGPLLLSKTSVAAVVAMQDTVTQETATKFLTRFCEEITKHGNVELGVNRARDVIKDNSDWWIPVLFSRLTTGELWYSPGFVTDGSDAALWDSIKGNLDEQAATAILGAELLSSVIGPTSEIARKLLANFFTRPGAGGAPAANGSLLRRLPVSETISDDLVQVTQYLAVMGDRAAVRLQLRQAIQSEIAARFESEQGVADSPADLLHSVSRAGKTARANDESDPLKLLARIPFCFYVTTTPDRALEDALNEAKPPREPVPQYFAWRERDRKSRRRAVTAPAPNYEDRSPEKPFVWYLLGTLENPDSVVLTEDDYLDYLVAMSSQRPYTEDGTDPNLPSDGMNVNVVPPAILRAITEDALMFIGFRLDDWSFRILLKSIAGLQNHDIREESGRKTVAVQIAPDQNRIIDPDLARKYLEEYFKKAGLGADVFIYWGTAREFLQELASKFPGGGR